MRHEGRADAARRIAAQSDDVAHADVPIAADHIVDFLARRRDASEMRGRLHIGFAGDARDDGVRAFARGAAGAIGHRNEFRMQRREAL